jgi:DNA-binding beta-propeller fold protein YncE
MAPRSRIVTGLAAGLASIAATAPATAQEPYGTATVVAGGLDNPRGLNFGPDGALFIAEAGRSSTNCFRLGREAFCAGGTGAIARLQGSALTRVATGLTSFGDRSGAFANGPPDVHVAQSGRIYTVLPSLGERPPQRLRRGLRRQLGKLLRVRNLFTATIAGLDRIEFARNPDRREVESNPYSLAVLGPDTQYVADAAGNTLLEVTAGVVSVEAVFPNAAPGAESVPTSVRVGPDGALYVGELTGERAPNGRARVWRIVPGQPPTVFATGFTRITGLDFGPDGSLFVTEFSRNLRRMDRRGRVVRVAPGGARTVLGEGKLSFPGGIAVAPDGAVYVSNWSVAPGRAARSGPLRGRTGQIVRLAP